VITRPKQNRIRTKMEAQAFAAPVRAPKSCKTTLAPSFRVIAYDMVEVCYSSATTTSARWDFHIA